MPLSRPLVIATLTVLLGCSGSPSEPPPVGPQPQQGEDTFSTNSLNRYDAHGARPSTWEIQSGTLSASGYALQSVLIRKDVSMADGWVETTSSRADDGGLVMGFQDNENYYLLAFRDDSAPAPRGWRNLALYKRRGPSEFTEVWTLDIVWPRGTPRTFRLELDDARLRVFVDGSVVGTWIDDLEAPLTGGIGVRHYGDNDAWEARFEVLRWLELLP